MYISDSVDRMLMYKHVKDFVTDPTQMPYSTFTYMQSQLLLITVHGASRIYSYGCQLHVTAFQLVQIHNRIIMPWYVIRMCICSLVVMNIITALNTFAALLIAVAISNLISTGILTPSGFLQLYCLSPSVHG